MRDARHPTSPSAAQGDDNDDGGAERSITKWKQNVPEIRQTIEKTLLEKRPKPCKIEARTPYPWAWEAPGHPQNSESRRKPFQSQFT